MAYNTQPPPVPPMQAAGGNRNAMNKPFDSKGERSWSYGLCDCFGDFGTCCVSYICPCIIYSQNRSRLEHLERQGYPHPDGGASCSGDGCLHCILLYVGCNWIVQMMNRASVRARYRIEGSGCGDCCTAWWCTPCELTQESRELELEEKSMIAKA